MTSPGRLADYLKARRERLQPEEVGTCRLGPRRVSGLRREEVAILAGISTDYYLRLEQGREIRIPPSRCSMPWPAPCTSIPSRPYLRILARPSRERVLDHCDDVHESTQWLIDSWPLTAAVVHNRYVDVLASNSLARALNPNFRRA